MKRPKPPSSRRTRPSKKPVIIGVEVPAATRAQIAKLQRIFKAQTIATLGVPTNVVLTRMSQQPGARRRSKS